MQNKVFWGKEPHNWSPITQQEKLGTHPLKILTRPLICVCYPNFSWIHYVRINDPTFCLKKLSLLRFNKNTIPCLLTFFNFDKKFALNNESWVKKMPIMSIILLKIWNCKYFHSLRIWCINNCADMKSSAAKLIKTKTHGVRNWFVRILSLSIHNDNLFLLWT